MAGVRQRGGRSREEKRVTDLRVLVVADDTLSRAGLAALLERQPGLILTGQATSSADVVETLAVYRPDAVLWDFGWNPAPGLARLPEVAEAATAARAGLVVLLPDATHAAEAWAGGARSLLLRDASPGALTAALAAAVQGLAVLDASLSAALVAAHGQPFDSPVEALTQREVQVLRLMAEGLPNKAIARELSISEHTVKFHVNAILGKLGVESRTEAVVRATRLGLIFL